MKKSIILLAVIFASLTFADNFYVKNIPVTAGSTNVVNFDKSPDGVLTNWVPVVPTILFISTDYDVEIASLTNQIISVVDGYTSNYTYGVYWTNIFDVTNIVDFTTNIYTTTNAFTTNAIEYVDYGAYTNTYNSDKWKVSSSKLFELLSKVAPSKIYIFSTNNANVSILAKEK